MKEIKFSENLRTLRISKSFSQSQLAKILGVDQRTISAWEKGVCEPNFALSYKSYTNTLNITTMKEYL